MSAVIFICTSIILLVLFLLQVRARRRVEKSYIRVFEYGDLQTIEILEKRMNMSYRINKVPQQIIKIRHNGEIIELKTFDLSYSNHFFPGMLNVLHHPDFPGIFIPEGSWESREIYADKSFSV
jgi:hypothetical protein